MRGRGGCYDNAVLDALAALRGSESPAEEVVAVGVGDLRAGMVLAGDVRTVPGILLATRGFVVTESFMARCRNTNRDELPGPLHVIVLTADPS
jgi:hypothetical protein